MRSFGMWIVVSAGLGLALGAPPAEACSLCQCGDPTLSLVGSRVFDAGAVRLSLDGDRYSKDQVAEDGEPGAREEQVEDRVTLSASRSFGDRVTLLARLPFSHRTLSSEGSSETSSGLSDPELTSHVRLAGSAAGDWLSGTAGVRMPWGQNDVSVDGERAEEHLQPGTGSWGGSAGLAFSRRTGVRSVLYGSAFGRFNGRNDAGYHYGDVALANLAWERRLNGRLSGVVEANFRSARRDEVAPGEPDPNTGGNVLYVTPRLLLRLKGDLWLRAGAQLPVWKDLYGDQDEKVNLLFGLTVKL